MLSKMFRIVRSKQMPMPDSVAGLRSLLAWPNRAMGTRCNALLRPSSRRPSERHCSSKDMKDIEDFLKRTKIRFLDIHQTNTEENLTRMELLLLASSFVFFVIMIGWHMYLNKKEFPTEIDYEKYAYDPNRPVKDDLLEEESKKTWKDHPLLKQV